MRPLNTCPVGCLKAANVAAMTTAILVTSGTTPIVKLIYAWNSIGVIVTVEAKPICVKILVGHTREAATRIT